MAGGLRAAGPAGRRRPALLPPAQRRRQPPHTPCAAAAPAAHVLQRGSDCACPAYQALSPHTPPCPRFFTTAYLSRLLVAHMQQKGTGLAVWPRQASPPSRRGTRRAHSRLATVGPRRPGGRHASMHACSQPHAAAALPLAKLKCCADRRSPGYVHA